MFLHGHFRGLAMVNMCVHVVGRFCIVESLKGTRLCFAHVHYHYVMSCHVLGFQGALVGVPNTLFHSIGTVTGLEWFWYAFILLRRNRHSCIRNQ